MFSYQQIKERLLHDIRRMPSDSKLLSRPELSKKYLVSRTTIDRAISELIGEGLLYARDGSGTYVAKAVEAPKSLNDFFTSWGVILPDIRHDTYPGILRGIEDVANANGINIVICNSDNEERKQADYIIKLIASRVSGIIIVPALIPRTDPEIFFHLEHAGIPLVFCNRAIEGVDAPKVFSNNFYGAYKITRHLLSNGYKRIGFITRTWYSIAFERFQGYLSALAEAGVQSNEKLYTFTADADGCIDETVAARTLINAKDPVDAIFCFNDSIAWNVFWELDKAGKRIGKDFGLVGYDNTHICDQCPIKLTSMDFRTYETGHESAKLLLMMTKKEPLEKNKVIVLHPKLEIRESSQKSE